MKNRKLLPIPKFASEDEERRFWETHDSTDYFDYSRSRRVRFPNLRPSTTSISLRLPAGMLEEIKIEANRRDVPYQSMLKIWISERLARARESADDRRFSRKS
jgi:predicted DNA binding CopG/RHH family protein